MTCSFLFQISNLLASCLENVTTLFEMYGFQQETVPKLNTKITKMAILSV